MQRDTMTIAQTTQTKFNTRGGLRTTKTTVHAHRIHGRNRLQKFIPNGRFLRSVGYDYNIEIILDMLKSNDWENATIIVGYRLSGKNCEPHVITDLMKEILCGRLKLRVPLKGEFHEKFFLANGDTADGIEFFTDVNGSPNPTMTGSAKRGQQSNRITEITIFGNYLQDPYYKETESQWDWYMSNSEAFDGELVELLDAREDEEWIPVIKRYYEGDPSVFEESTLTPIEVLTLSAGEEMLRNSAKGVMVTQLDLPEIPADAIQSFIEDIGSIGFEARSTNSGQIELPTSLIDSARYSSEHIPWMQIIDGDLLLRIEGETISRRNPNLSQVEEIKNELHRFEEFIDSTDNSHRPGLKSKMALSEFLLSGMCAPFDYLWMAQRRTKFNRVREGPQMTSYLGGSGNGKSFASRYLLKMISGRDLEPLPSKQFTEKRVRSCARNGSIMPLIFDDLKRIRIREWDKWGKTLWDRGYVFDKPHAQLIVTANDPIDSAGPLGRRVREIRMEATFENNGENTEIVETCLKECSQIFPYFSEVVLRMHESGSAPYEHNDPLKIGRLAIEELYKIANLEAPEWWCPLPFEECVDINAYHWYDILHKELFKIERRLDSFRIPVNEGTHEINERLKSFPAHLQAKKAGKSIHIENADGFIAWISKVQHLYENDKGRSSRKMRHLLSKGKWPRF